MVVPQVAMLFYAIYLRIHQYDITINRYFVVVFGIWLLSVSLYYIFSKQKYLAVLPALLTLFTLLISVGPWSVYQLPESRQFTRLEKKLIEANILQEGKIVPLIENSAISSELSNDIYDGIEYVCGFNDCEKIKNLFSVQYEAFVEKHKADYKKNREDEKLKYAGDANMLKYIEKNEYQEPSKWEIVSALTNEIKIYQNYGNQSDDEIAYYSFYIDSTSDFFPLELDGYDQMIRIDNQK